jgi:hypothetical protein
MAEESGGFKAADFYVGVVDLFAILLPGAILAFVITQCIPWGALPVIVKALSPPSVAYLCFAVAAYITGHFLSALGSVVMDHVYDRWYKKRFGRKLKRRRGRVKRLLKRALDIPDKDNALDWTLALLRVRAPGALAPLDRLEADSKFFRSLALALVLSWPLIQFAVSGWSTPAWTASALVLILVAFQSIARKIHGPVRQRSRILDIAQTVFFLSPILLGVVVAAVSLFYTREKNLQFALIAVGCYGLAVMAGLRYMTLRLKRTQIAYELLIVLAESSAGPDNLADITGAAPPVPI